MIIYNVTVKVDPAIADEWVKWMKEEHIPDVMMTGMFAEHKFLYLLDQDESDGVTFAVQYISKNMASYEKYKNEFAAEMQQKHLDKYEGRFVAFRTLMEVL